MGAARYDMKVEQGSTFDLTLVWNDPNNSPRNLTGYSAQMQIRTEYDSDTVIDTLSSANGEITLFANTGTIAIDYTAQRTANLPVDLSSSSLPPVSRFVYDLEITAPDGKVTKLIRGYVIASGEVTR